VQKLVKALPTSDLEKRLAGLEKTVARLGASLRQAAKRTVRKAGARKSTARKRTARKTSARAVAPVA
jgi:hypothetical protein